MFRLARDRHQLALESVDVFNENAVHHIGEFQSAITADRSDLGAVLGERGSKYPGVMVSDLANLFAGRRFEYINRVVSGSKRQFFAVGGKGNTEQRVIG